MLPNGNGGPSINGKNLARFGEGHRKNAVPVDLLHRPAVSMRVDSLSIKPLKVAEGSEASVPGLVIVTAPTVSAAIGITVACGTHLSNVL